MAGVPLDDEVDRLYALPLDEFTAQRNALSARLKKAGDKAEAETIKRLAKPSLTAWALNQVARREPGCVDELLDQADRLRTAQQALLSGGRAPEFREATERERQAVRELASKAM